MKIEYEVLIDVGGEMADVELTTSNGTDAIGILIRCHEEGYRAWINVYCDDEYVDTIEPTTKV